MNCIVAIKKIDEPGGSPLNWNDSCIQTLTGHLETITELSGFDLDSVRNSSVLLHPNLVRPHKNRPASFTDPRVVIAAAQLFLEAGAKSVQVGENPGFGFPARKAFEESGLIEPLKKMNVSVVCFDESQWVKVNNKQGRLYRDVIVSKHILDTDYLINLPKMKTHMLTQVSLSIKNMLGAIHDDQRILFHRNDIADKVVDLNLVRSPDLNIVDGLWPMEGQAPFHGHAIKGFNVLVAGTHAAAVDSICCSIMGFETREVPHVQLALKRLCCDSAKHVSITCKGNSIETVKRIFKRPVLSSMAQFDGIECIECGVCNGCLSAIRHSLDWLNAEIDFNNLKPVTVVSGRPMPNMNTMETWNGRLVLFGNCAAEFQFYDYERRADAVWIPGCPPHVLDLANLVRKQFLIK